ncbi:MAG: FAD-binding protein, partial [Stenotrophomonas maltophilia]
GAVLRDESGRAFMTDYHPLADLAPRDVVSRAIVAEMKRGSGGRVLLDISHLAAETVQSRFPTIYSFCLGYGVDITKEPVPVAPAAHYMMGGVKIDTWGRTNIQGLYACGEVACSAVHGANRLASNSLLDTLVFAQRLIASSIGHAPERQELLVRTPEETGDVTATLRPRQLVCASMPALSKEALQDLLWRNAGISRHGSRLLLTARILCAWERTMPEPTDQAGYELRNLLLLGRLMVEAALIRQESRGSHFREDFPDTSPNWEKHVQLTGEGVAG